MKQRLKDAWDNFVGGSLAIGGCALTAALFLGVIYLFVLFGKWLWTIEWFHSAVSCAGQFIAQNADFFEYLFGGGFLAYLLMCLIVFIVGLFRDGYKYAVSKDFFGRSKRFLLKCAKIIGVIIIILLLLFCIGKCASDNNFNGEDHIPTRYRG